MRVFARYGLIGCLCGGLLFLGGCGGPIHNTWKSARGFYYAYFNPPASINYADAGNLNASQARLAHAIRPIDVELMRFERYMLNQDKPPSPERVDALFERFGWVNGVAALSPGGEVLAQEPPASLKPLDFMAFAAIKAANPQGLRGDVQTTPLGPEVLLGVPVFNSSELKGYYVAHFDMQMLVDRSPDPDSLIIMSPQGMLWGGPNAADTGVARQEWSKVVKKRIAGRLGGYYWICRYFGGVPLIFASPETENFAMPRARETPDQPEEAESEQALQRRAREGA
jgi:hypothetical protein